MLGRKAEGMRVSYLSVLAVLRELYIQPRNMRRFREYVRAVTGRDQ
jgi:hypothetical protein